MPSRGNGKHIKIMICLLLERKSGMKGAKKDVSKCRLTTSPIPLSHRARRFPPGSFESIGLHPV